MDLEKIKQHREQEKAKKEQLAKEAEQKAQADKLAGEVGSGARMGTVATQSVGKKITASVDKSAKTITKELQTSGEKVMEAISASQVPVAEALNNLVVATVLSKDPNLIQAAQDLTSLLASINKAGADFKSSKLNDLPKTLDKLASSVQGLVDTKTINDTDQDYTPVLSEIRDLLAEQERDPAINVAAPNVTIDTTAFEKAVKSLEKTVKDSKVVLPAQNDRNVIEAVGKVQQAISSLSFPVPNYVLPFRDVANGKASQVQLKADGSLPVTVVATTGGGLTDTELRATPVPVSGTVTATPTGTQNVDVTANTIGLATGAKQDTGNTSLGNVDTKTPALGQALAAASTPVVLTAAQITTLTPPAAITGFATETTLASIKDTSGIKKITDALPAGTNAIGKLAANSGVDIGDVDITSIAAGDNNIGNVDIVTVPADPFGVNADASSATGSISAKLKASATALEIIDDWDESDRAKVNSIVGQAGVAAGAGATGATVQRVVQANDAGKTILSASGSASTSGNNTLVAAGTNKLKVAAFSLTTLSTTAVTCIFQSGASGTELWRVVLQAITGASTGANLSVNLPAYLFATGSATLLNLNLSSANAVHWSVSYIDEA